jgi:hypothetical protein
VLFESMMCAIEESSFSFGVKADYQGLLTEGIDAEASMEMHQWWKQLICLDVDPGAIRDPLGTSPAFLRTMELNHSSFIGKADRLLEVFYRTRILQG